MTPPLYSPHWYRVAGLRPALRPHTEIHRHVYRGQPWYILQDHASGRLHRFSPAAYAMIGLMNGRRTLEEIWDQVDARLDDAAPTQHETIELLARLHAADALQTEITPDTEEMFHRLRKQRSQQFKSYWWNPLAIRLPLFDPTSLLDRLMPLARLLFSRGGFLLWSGIVTTALVMAAIHWPNLSRDMNDRLLTPSNLLLLGLCYPVIKLLHELGHGLATRFQGGEVHEMGVMLLALLPAPYVDASAAAVFPTARQRILVSAAGVMTEAFIASLALFVWLLVEPGALHATAYNVMLMAGFSTLFVNGNPLLRFDGYYVFADTIGIPNLAGRANRYIGHLIQTRLFGLKDLPSPAHDSRERLWLGGYAVAAFFYRLFILATIALFISERYALAGMLLAGWALVSQLLVPGARLFQRLLNGPELQPRRTRAITVTALLGGTLLLGITVLPAPLTTLATGVVWLPEQADLRAATDGEVKRLLARPGSRVKKGDPLVELEDPLLPPRRARLEARLRELKARDAALRDRDPVKAAMVRDQMPEVEADLNRVREQIDALTLRSPTDGIFLVERPADLPGRFLHKGDHIAYVADPNTTTIRVVIPQADADLVLNRTRGAEVRLASQPTVARPAALLPTTRAGNERLPSPALGPRGGGPFATDPSDPNADRTLERLFQLDLRLDAPMQRIGERVRVRFDHGPEPLLRQWYRRLSQLILRRLDV